MTVARYIFDPIRDRQIGNVADIELVWLVGGEFPAHQVRKHRGLLIRDGGGDLAFLRVSEKLQGLHDPCDPLVVHRSLIILVFEFSRDPFRTITTAFGGEDRLDPSTEDRIGHETFSTS